MPAKSAGRPAAWKHRADGSAVLAQALPHDLLAAIFTQLDVEDRCSRNFSWVLRSAVQLPLLVSPACDLSSAIIEH